MLIESFIRGLNAGKRLTPVEWMRRNVVVPHSARNTRFDPATSPWMNEPIAEIAKDTNTEIVISAPVGSGKTTLFEALLAWIVSENPGPTLVTGQTDKTAKQWAESRLAPMLEAIPSVSKLFPKDRHQKRKTEILFPHMPLFIGGANLTSLQEKSIRWNIGDEVWRWKKGMLGEFRRRTHDRWNARCILVSQGGEEGDDFHDAEDLCEKRDFAWHCTECDAWTVWDFQHIKFDRPTDTNGNILWEQVAKSARLVCPHCQHDHPDDPRIRRTLSTSSKYLTTSPGAPGHIAFHYDAAAVWWIPWGTLAVEWTKADLDLKSGDPDTLKQFVQKRNARRWVDKSTGPSDSEVLSCRGQHLRGSCPTDPLIITFGADIGQDTQHWAAVAWAANGTAFVIDYGTATGIEDLEGIATSLKYQTPSGREATVAHGMLDSGYNTGTVYGLCWKTQGFLYPAKGSNANMGTVSESILKDYPALPLYTVNEWWSKVWLFNGKIKHRSAPFLWFPKDSDDTFLRAFMGQRPDDKKGRREWRKVPNDHFADAIRLNHAIVHRLLLAGAITFEKN
jgi:phage terminase large subunit GpA-like protein